MTDEERELLKLAAKACGMNWIDDSKFGLTIQRTEGGTPYNFYWNPWRDDGDSGRMGAQLRICVLWQQDWVQAYIGDIYVRECYQGDRAKALRHAYVRVAAEVGKNIHN